MAEQEWVWISHPDVTEPAQVTLASLEEVWSEQGWTECDAPVVNDEEVSSDANPSPNLFDFEEDDLQEEGN